MQKLLDLVFEFKLQQLPDGQIGYIHHSSSKQADPHFIIIFTSTNSVTQLFLITFLFIQQLKIDIKIGFTIIFILYTNMNGQPIRKTAFICIFVYFHFCALLRSQIIDLTENQNRQLTLEEIQIKHNATLDQTLTLNDIYNVSKPPVGSTASNSSSNSTSSNSSITISTTNLPKLVSSGSGSLPIQVSSDYFLNPLNYPGLPNKFFSAYFPYPKIPNQYWPHRIQLIKAMGMNALSLDVVWNFHQLSKGVFQYASKERNLKYLLQLAQKEQMYVLLAIGPYVGRDWDFGGLPRRLLSDKLLKIRSNNSRFLSQVRTFFQSLAQLLKSSLRTKASPKSPIILIKLEQRYSLYGTNLDYMQQLKKILLQLGINCPMYHQQTAFQFDYGHWQGAHVQITGVGDVTGYGPISQIDIDTVKNNQKFVVGRVFPQIATGLMIGWGQAWKNKSTISIINQLKTILNNNGSFSMYSIIAGTNFGLLAGAHQNGKSNEYTQYLTNFMQDAPISQQGRTTSKYKSLKDLILKFVEWTVPPEPSPLPTMSVPFVSLSAISYLLQPLPKMILSLANRPFSLYSNQIYQAFSSYSSSTPVLVVYQTRLARRNYNFVLKANDFGLVYLDGKLITQFDRSQRVQHPFEADCINPRGCILKILVEPMGGISQTISNGMANDDKGIIDLRMESWNVIYSYFMREIILLWDIYLIPISTQLLKSASSKLFSPKNSPAPTALLGNFTLQNSKQPSDTYLEVQNLSKGYLFINGYLLGRYWNKGPQNKLFCPGVWLKKGLNQILVVDLVWNQKIKDLKERGVIGRNSTDKSV